MENTEGSEKFRRCFQKYYAKLCAILPVDDILPNLLSCEVVTMKEMDEIEAKETSSAKASALLRGPVWRAIDAGLPDTFVILLCVMRALGIRSCREFSEEICNKLDISDEVISQLTGKLH